MTDMQKPSTLVSSSDVNGTAVYGTDGSRVGEIDHLMIDKVSGNISYAVMGFGGFLGLGEGYYPIPWKKLKYDPAKDGFTTDISEEQLKKAPQHSPDWKRDRAWEKRTYDYYGIGYYWM